MPYCLRISECRVGFFEGMLWLGSPGPVDKIMGGREHSTGCWLPRWVGVPSILGSSHPTHSFGEECLLVGSPS